VVREKNQQLLVNFGSFFESTHLVKMNGLLQACVVSHWDKIQTKVPMEFSDFERKKRSTGLKQVSEGNRPIFFIS
jgi:hypothetical protein